MLPTVLHVGSGTNRLPAWLPTATEVRIDIDPSCAPDIIGTITALGDIGPFDGYFASHCLEHVYPHEVDIALAECLRVLKPGAEAVILVPDLEGIKPTLDVVYQAPCGPITGLDMYYGLREALHSKPYMAHHSGFLKETLDAAMRSAGFSDVRVHRVDQHQLIAIGTK